MNFADQSDDQREVGYFIVQYIWSSYCITSILNQWVQWNQERLVITYSDWNIEFCIQSDFFITYVNLVSQQTFWMHVVAFNCVIDTVCSVIIYSFRFSWCWLGLISVLFLVLLSFAWSILLSLSCLLCSFICIHHLYVFIVWDCDVQFYADSGFSLFASFCVCFNFIDVHGSDSVSFKMVQCNSM